ncbi:unnamed protein product [Pleuronectes platessa]|uniref:Uncharacterized protein n=1 Tax=Pleuronectes platessa TaxID=8262 RepID=A0A9N7V1F4_PLEPL|nr:unnamed protein product [Pleuronectes platessa]
MTKKKPVRKSDLLATGASLSSFSFLFSIIITSKSRAAAVATPWIKISGSRIIGRSGGSSMADSISCGLIVVVMADPVSRWHQIMVVDHDRGHTLTQAVWRQRFVHRQPRPLMWGPTGGAPSGWKEWQCEEDQQLDYCPDSSPCLPSCLPACLPLLLDFQ